MEIHFRCNDGKCYFVENIKYKNIENFIKSIRFKRWINVKELGLIPFEGKINVKDITFIWESKKRIIQLKYNVVQNVVVMSWQFDFG